MAAASPSAVTGFNLYLSSQLGSGDVEPPPPPPPETFELTIIVRTDKYPNESSWVMKDDIDTTVAERSFAGEERETEYSDVLNLEAGAYTFTMFDSYGDGMCCSFGEGYWRLVAQDGTEIAAGGEFTDQESAEFTLGS